METIRTVERMKQALRFVRGQERLLGLVPTMGALHEGHFSLIQEARKRCSAVAVSLFVNPAQFGPTDDLAKYPRPFERDRQALEQREVDYLFAPSAEEMYPRGFSTAVTVGGLSDLFEGRSRPGHFQGVTTVVLKLLEIVRPDFCFLGRKDAQQDRIVRQMVQDLNLDSVIVTCPIVREPDGLALSSRNAYLKDEDRRRATVLYKSLAAARRDIEAGERDVTRLLAAVQGVFVGEPEVTLDYADIVDRESFERVRSLEGNCYILLAARVAGTRLIDNALIEEDGGVFLVTV